MYSQKKTDDKVKKYKKWRKILCLFQIINLIDLILTNIKKTSIQQFCQSEHTSKHNIIKHPTSQLYFIPQF